MMITGMMKLWHESNVGYQEVLTVCVGYFVLEICGT